jgi:hypothetical protein
MLVVRIVNQQITARGQGICQTGQSFRGHFHRRYNVPGRADEDLFVRDWRTEALEHGLLRRFDWKVHVVATVQQ